MIFIGGSADGKSISVPDNVQRYRVPAPSLSAWEYGRPPLELRVDSYRRVTFNTADGIIEVMVLEGVPTLKVLEVLIAGYTTCREYEKYTQPYSYRGGDSYSKYYMTYGNWPK